ncbi:hypothetical protein [Catellatospora sp. NPDC049609]|uniref:hypothetical protein n=1 Tax=Catellatospora sp. NPDC049609 TaxID=3155505 RepID=UPI00342A5F16
MSSEERMVPGYLYVDHTDPEHPRAVAGGRVTLPAPRPPWLLVHRSLDQMLVTRWPVRLFRVAEVPPATERERAVLADAVAELLPIAGFTRAACVDVLEELSPALLFGPYGAAVARVLDAGCALDEQTAHRLAQARHRNAEQAYRAAWRRWLDGPRVSGASSPVGSGFALLHRVVGDSARLRGRPGAWVVDGDGEDVVAEPWRAAFSALLEAAMAYGAPDLSDGAAGVAMSTAWHAVYGPMP